MPEPLKDEVNKISKLLAYFYQQITSQNEAQETLIIDWERLLEEASSGLPNHLKDSLHNSVNFILTKRCCDGFSVLDNDIVIDYTDKNLKVYTSDNDFMNRLKGTILFTLALSLSSGQRGSSYPAAFVYLINHLGAENVFKEIVQRAVSRRSAGIYSGEIKNQKGQGCCQVGFF